MRYYRFYILTLSMLTCAGIYPQIPVDKTVNNHALNEVVVYGENVVRLDDHIMVSPTKQQRKHANTGYDLIRNLMIPGVNVDRHTGVVSSPAGNVTLYIDGREATYREIQSLRPKDIAKVEYYDVPSGKYAKDAAAINIVMKTPSDGGYIQLDALQGIGFLKGDYNLISEYIISNKSLNLWAGSSVSDPRSSFWGEETMKILPIQEVRTTNYTSNKNREDKSYVQASISNRSTSTIWMLRGGLAWNTDQNSVENGLVKYRSTSSDLVMDLYDKERSMRPSLFFYGSHSFSDKRMLDFVIDGYYSRNHHYREYDEASNNYRSSATEDYYYTKLNANYSVSKDRRRFAFSFYEFLRISASDYSGGTPYNQHLRSSETIVFADYSQSIGSFFYNVNPGVSFMTYKLGGVSSVNHLTPRLQIRAAYMIDRTQQLQLAFALGNTYPMVNTINKVEQQLDPIIILRGNPDMDNSILLSPRLSYNMNFGKIVLQSGISYFYQNHAIIKDYFTEGSHLICSFRDDARYHKFGADLSVTYKPSGDLNINVSGDWSRHIVDGSAPHCGLTSLNTQAEVNWYVGDFSLNVSMRTPQHTLCDYQIRRRTDWCYELSAMWNQANWGVEINANNLLLLKNKVSEEINTHYYSYNQQLYDKRYNQYATLKVVYNFDYGKKTSKTPEYQHTVGESAILK